MIELRTASYFLGPLVFIFVYLVFKRTARQKDEKEYQRSEHTFYDEISYWIIFFIFYGLAMMVVLGIGKITGIFK